MKRLLVLPIVVGLAALAMSSVASAHSFQAGVTCTGASYFFGAFDAGSTNVIHETVSIDNNVVATLDFTFVGVEGTNTVPISVPAGTHTVTLNATWTVAGGGNQTISQVISGCGRVCTYTKGFYRNHASSTSSVIGSLGGSLPVGNASLNASQAQAILNATPGKPGNVTFSSNNFLNLVQQLISAELNGARGSGPTLTQQQAISAANAGITTGTAGGGIQLSTSLTQDQVSSLISTLDGFNSANDCG